MSEVTQLPPKPSSFEPADQSGLPGSPGITGSQPEHESAAHSNFDFLTKLPRIPMPLIVALLTLGALITVVAWAVSSPPGSTPDEDFHIGSIWCPRPAGEYCETTVLTLTDPLPGGGEYTRDVKHIWIPLQMAHANCNAPVSAMSAACFDILGQAGYIWSNRFDDGLYPTGFYRAMHLFTESGSNWVNSVFTMRVINGALSVLLFGAAAYLFTHRNRRLMTYALLLVLVPMILYLLVSISPTGWGIAGVTLAWLGLHGFFTEHQRWRRNGLLALAAIGGLMAGAARGDTGLFAALAALAIVVMHWKLIWRNWRLFFAPMLVAGLGALGFVNSGQVGAAAEGLAAQGPGGYLLTNTLEMPAFLLDSIAGSLNWFDTPLPAISRIPIVMIAAAVAFKGLRHMDIPKALALMGLLFTVVALPLIILEITGTQLGLYVQPRYVTPIMPLLMLTALWNPQAGKLPKFSQTQLWVIWATLALGHAWALHTQILRFTHGTAIRWWNLNTAPEWWAFGISPMATWTLGSLGFSLFLLSIFAVSGHYHRPHVVAPPVAVLPTVLMPDGEASIVGTQFFAPVANVEVSKVSPPPVEVVEWNA